MNFFFRKISFAHILSPTYLKNQRISAFIRTTISEPRSRPKREQKPTTILDPGSDIEKTDPRLANDTRTYSTGNHISAMARGSKPKDFFILLTPSEKAPKAILNVISLKTNIVGVIEESAKAVIEVKRVASIIANDMEPARPTWQRRHKKGISANKEMYQ